MPRLIDPGRQSRFQETSEQMMQELMPQRKRSSRKGENGVVTIVGGSWVYHGAPVLSALAAQRIGVDLVYVAVPKTISTAVRAISPTFIVLPLPDAKLTVGCANRLLTWFQKVDSLALGPGMGLQKTTGMEKLVEELVTREIKVVLDADALVPNVIAKLNGKASVITPHAGEFKRIFGLDLPDSLIEKADMVRMKAKEAGTTILLKGQTDIISDGEKIIMNHTGSPAMTVGGTGDVLTGLVVGLMAKGMGPVEASAAGSYLNGSAGEEAVAKLGLHITATDIISELPKIMIKYDGLVD